MGSVAFLEIWNLAFRVDAIADWVLVLAGAVGLYVNLNWLLKKVGQARSTSNSKLFIYGVIVFIIALRAAGPCEHFDTALYGAQAVQWITTYPAVFGLANLHARLGFNSSIFLCHAAFDQALWRNLYFHVFPGLLLCALWIPILRVVSSILKHNSALASDWFYAILLIPTNWWSTRGDVVGTMTDEPTAVVALSACGILFQWLATRDQESAVGDSRLFTAAALLSLSVTFKLSVIVFAAASILMITWRLKRQPGLLTPMYTASALLMLPWLVRGVITSGYVFFPNTMFAFPVDWRVPAIYAQVNAVVIQSWGRMPGVMPMQTRGWAWLRPWVHAAMANRVGFQVPLAIALLGTAAILTLRSRYSNPLQLSGLWILLPSMTGLCFWFLEAPGLRFASAMIWAAAASLGALGFAISSEMLYFRPRIILSCIFLATLWCGFGWPHSYKMLKSVSGFAFPVNPVEARKTQSGLVVYVPIRGKECWNAVIPCTPYFSPSLRLRKPFDFRQGFRSEGLPPEVVPWSTALAQLKDAWLASQLQLQ